MFKAKCKDCGAEYPVYVEVPTEGVVCTYKKGFVCASCCKNCSIDKSDDWYNNCPNFILSEKS